MAKRLITVLRRCRTNSRIQFEDDKKETIVPTAAIRDEDGGSYLYDDRFPETISVKKKFETLITMINLVVTGTAPSLFIYGEPGTGKTFNAMQCVNVAKYKAHNDEGVKPKGKVYYLAKGRVSPLALYRTLFEHNGEMIVFDDCDCLFEEKTSTAILKAALDSYDRRIVTWDSPFPGRAGLPTAFEFTGKVIFISNLLDTQIHPAILSRCLKLQFTLTREDTLERMRAVVQEIPSTLNEHQRREVFHLVKKNSTEFREFSLRTLVNAFRIRESSPTEWRKLIVNFA